MQLPRPILFNFWSFTMVSPSTVRLMSACAAALAIVAFSMPAVAQVNAAAAQELFEDAECDKCHSADQDKKGPSLKKTAAKYKAKADAEKLLIEHMSKVQMVKQNDGKEIKHPIVDTKDPKVKKNMAQWILSH
jgi:cytochrome c